MSTHKTTNQDHFFLDLWSLLQEGYRKIPRWGEYRKANPKLPLQTNLEHQNSLDWLFQSALPFVGSKQLCRRVLSTACKVHELGEVDNGDTLFHNKTPDKHLRELLSFEEIVSRMDFVNTFHKDMLREAFILQFVTDKKVTFEGHPWAERKLENARFEYFEEGQVFNALETLDYVLYAIHGYRVCGDVVILKHIYSNQVEILDQYSVTIPGFDVWWDKKMSSRAHRFMRKYADIPGPKDEGGIPAAYAYAVEKGYMTI